MKIHNDIEDTKDPIIEEETESTVTEETDLIKEEESQEEEEEPLEQTMFLINNKYVISAVEK